MSRKSRQPDDGADTSSTKRKKGKKGKSSTGEAKLVVSSKPEGVPFSVVVLMAAALSLPSVSVYLGGGLAFDALMMRVFAALAVSWLLSQLVYAVFEWMRPSEVQAVVELPPGEAFEALSGTPAPALTGTIVGEPEEADPFELPALEPLEPLPPQPEVGRDESAA